MYALRDIDKGEEFYEVELTLDELAHYLFNDLNLTNFQDKAKKIVEGIKNGEGEQILLGVTGSGKTFTMAKVIEAVQRPTLIMAPNKTLAAQLYGEMKSLFPKNAVEYFVSYYDYYTPEAYVPRTDTYIEKESSINEQIDRLRHSSFPIPHSTFPCLLVIMKRPWAAAAIQFFSASPRL